MSYAGRFTPWVEALNADRDRVREEAIREVCDWLEGRAGHGGAFTSADDVRDAIRARFLQPARHEQDHQHQQHNQQDRNQEVRGDGGGGNE